MDGSGKGSTDMKRITGIAIGAVAALIVTATATAGPPYTGTTDPLGDAVSGTTLDVAVTVNSATPVVAYEYSIQNECKLPDRTLTYQRDDIVYWSQGESGGPYAVMPIYLQSVDAGATCKVFLMRNNTQVKGSVTSYPVVAPTPTPTP